MANLGSLLAVNSVQQPVRQGETIPLLDIFRVLAAWMVLAWHTSDYIGYRLPVFGSAAVAVDVFMNISGFLMLFHFWERQTKEPWEKPATWLKFYLRRFFRIAPLYYFALLFLAAIGMASTSANSTNLPLWQWLLLRISFLFGFSPAQSTNCVMPDWSLTLEMQFYFAFPFLALAIRKFGAGLFFFLCSAIAAASRFLIGYYNDAAAGHLIYFPQPTILPLKIQTFAVGMIVALILVEGIQSLKSKWFYASFPIYLLTCKENFLWLLAAIYWTSFLICLLPKARTRFFNLLKIVDQKFSKMPLRKTLADCSYGTYLIHNIIIALVLTKIWPQLPKGHGSFGRFALAFLLILFLTTMFSYLLYRIVEKPAINSGKKIMKNLATGKFSRAAQRIS